MRDLEKDPPRTLNRNRPFGQVYGEPIGYSFEQDGRHFSGDGTEICSGPAASPVSLGIVEPPSPALTMKRPDGLSDAEWEQILAMRAPKKATVGTAPKELKRPDVQPVAEQPQEDDPLQAETKRLVDSHSLPEIRKMFADTFGKAPSPAATRPKLARAIVEARALSGSQQSSGQQPQSEAAE